MTSLTDRLREHAQLHDDLRSGDPDQEQWADDLRTAAHAIDRLLWKSIETAPKDGTVVDLWLAGPRNSGARRPDCWFKNGQWWCDCLDRGDLGPEFYVDDLPTHWMPLPAPPNVGNNLRELGTGERQVD